MLHDLNPKVNPRNFRRSLGSPKVSVQGLDPRGQERHSTFPSTWILHNCLQAWPCVRPRPPRGPHPFGSKWWIDGFSCFSCCLGANTCATPSYRWVQTSPKMGFVSPEFSTGYTFGFLQEYLSTVTDLNQEVFPPLRIALRIIWFLWKEELEEIPWRLTRRGNDPLQGFSPRRVRLPFLETRAPPSDPNSWSNPDPTANCTVFTTESRMNITNEHHEWTSWMNLHPFIQRNY